MKSPLLQLSGKNVSRREDRTGIARRDFRRTHYDYQATAEAPARSTALTPPDTTTVQTAEMRSFRRLSRTAVGPESRWRFAMETAVLGLIVAIVAWPLVTVAILLAQIAHGWL